MNQDFRSYRPRKMRLGQMIHQCGVYATARHLKLRGYTCEEALQIIRVNLLKR